MAERVAREQRMRVRRFAAPLGAIVEDLDVRHIDDATWLRLNALFCEHHVLAFPGQRLSPEDQMNFARRWGALVRHPYSGLDAYPDVIELRNQGKARDINQHWHSDMTYNVAPPKLTMLYALEAPDIGGDTAFANQELAYDALSQGLRSVVDGLKAVHTAEDLAIVNRQDPKQAPRAEHPVVRVHDETGRKSLYVCRAFTQRFVGWSREESAPLLEYLYRHGARPEFQARHVWTAGDLVMWDNRCLQHFAVHDHDDSPRVIHRVQVEGPVPA